MTCNTFICSILFGLLESSKITLFKKLVGMIIEAKVAEISGFFLHFSVTLTSIISMIKSLNKVILDNSHRPNIIVQINFLHVIYSVIVIEIFDVKVVYVFNKYFNVFAKLHN